MTLCHAMLGMEFAPIEQQIKGQILFFQQLVDVPKVIPR